MITEITDSKVLGLSAHPDEDTVRQRVLRYYREAGADYGAWSSGFHMHFGYYRRGLSPFNREAMLEEMTRQVLRRLELEAGAARVLDAGCGLGASARLIAAERPELQVDGVTLVPEQVARARELNAGRGLDGRLRFFQADYTAAPLPDARYDAAYAIESACHATGLAKEDFVREVARLLRPGGRLVVADGFLKGVRPLGSFLGLCHRRICDHWALETFAELGSFLACLEAHGFEEVRAEDASWRIAPSVTHIPWVTLRFLARELLKDGGGLNADRRGHLVACVLSPLLGMARHRFGYYLVSARRR